MTTSAPRERNQFRVDGKVALVTGGYGGIGQAVCNGLGAIGAVQFFVSPASSFITGQTLYLDGGITATQ